MSELSRYAVGIDLGTTNCALAYIDTAAGPTSPCRVLDIPQVVQPGSVESRPLLPSFVYLPGEGEQPAGSLKLPWSLDREYAIGEFARNFGSQVPTRLISSSKSWLCHPGVDRRSALLPWKAPEGAMRVSPVEVARMLLQHLTEAWNAAMATGDDTLKLENQDIVLTVPASFDAVARDLTVEAARLAGLHRLTLLEEPQAAFYAWLQTFGKQWRDLVAPGDLVLVADIGGGTSDFSLIEVTQDGPNLGLNRLAVGDHLLLGGDNMDLSLAYAVAKKFADAGNKPDSAQMLSLIHSVRQAKETLLEDAKETSAPITLLGRGSKVLKGTKRGELTRAEVESSLVDGFFPLVTRDSTPAKGRSMGFQELGLPYVADAGITRHLAQFLARHRETLSKSAAGAGSGLPTAILFNGGVFRADVLRQRMSDVLNSWATASGAPPVRVLAGADTDLAVARGAAAYNMVRRGRGIRIRGGTARSYYVGVASSMPAIPGYSPPINGLCVVRFGMEEGSESEIPGQEFGLVVGEPVEFEFFSSSNRQTDTIGSLIEEIGDLSGEVEKLAPLAMTLTGEPDSGRVVPVHLHARVTEVGLLELSCRTRDNAKEWKLEFNVREE